MEPIALVAQEALNATRRYGDFTSTHEALGVLEEEMHELRIAIRSNRLDHIADEAKQVSAVAYRLYELCGRAPRSFAVRSGAEV